MVLGVVRRGQPGEAAAREEGIARREQEQDLESIVERFNQMFSRIYSFLHGRVGEEVDPFMDEALARITPQYELLFYGVDLKQYGRADYDQMLANVADLPPDERRRLMLAGLNELVASDPAERAAAARDAGDRGRVGHNQGCLPQVRGRVAGLGAG